MSENTSNVLLLAHQLAPQVAEITMNAAALLITRAANMPRRSPCSRPLAADPHDAGLAAAAREMIEQARCARGTRAPRPRTASAEN